MARAHVQTFSVQEAEAAIDANCVRLARQLRHSARRVVGILPASDTVVAWPMVLELGLVLSKLCGAFIAVTDIEQSWPDLVPMLEAADVEVPLPAGLEFVERQLLAPSLVRMSPRERVPRGAKVDMLEVMLEHLAGAKTTFRHVLVDMTGIEERIGEFLGIIGLVDGVITLGRAAVTRERDLLRMHSALPREKNLGVVLVD